MKIRLPTPNDADRQPANGATAPPDAQPSSAPPSIDIMAMFAQGNGPTSQVPDDDQQQDGNEVPADNLAVPPSGNEPPAPKPEDRLAETTSALTRAVEALTQRSNTPATPANPTPEPPKGPKVWITPEQVPQAMTALLHSEDPAERLQGLVVFGNALVNMLYSQFQNDVTTQYQPQFQAMVQDHYQQQQLIQNFRTDMTTNYPALVNSEPGRLVAQHVIQKVSAARVAAGKSVNWFDPDFRKAFDAELTAMKIDPKLGTQASPPPPPPRPTPMGRSGGSRPVDPAPENKTQQDHMMGMLSTVMPKIN